MIYGKLEPWAPETILTSRWMGAQWHLKNRYLAEVEASCPHMLLQAVQRVEDTDDYTSFLPGMNSELRQEFMDTYRIPETEVRLHLEVRNGLVTSWFLERLRYTEYRPVRIQDVPLTCESAMGPVTITVSGGMYRFHYSVKPFEADETREGAEKLLSRSDYWRKNDS